MPVSELVVDTGDKIGIRRHRGRAGRISEYRAGSGGGWPGANGSTDVWDGNPHVLGVVYDGTTETLYVDGASDGSATVSKSALTLGELLIGAMRNGTYINYAAGKIQQIIVVSGVIDSGDQVNLEAWLAAKNGATI